MPGLNSFLILAVVLCATPALAQSSLPSDATPGAVNPEVTEETIGRTICVAGWTRTIRPPSSYTSYLKKAQIKQFGYADTNPRDYEEDHLIPLELGGAPRDPRNLWPEPRHPVDGWGAAVKDRLENRLREMVCDGELTLRAARSAIATDWIEAYQRYGE